MKLFAVAVRDSAAVAYHAPLFFPALGMAERWFRDECNSRNPDAQIARHPADYDLYLVGYYETDDGTIESDPPRLVLRGAECQVKPS